ncbi:MULTISPECIES: polyphosphate kinase 1 [unclassified Leptolyngbya]|uniref:polyphosphate kinase 1 n=1 Tax=unclassified Leptolyngbya TaxID=2650499 RepID=UPI00168A22A7|nr:MULTISPECIES: polyphosphate kinase 1 [unclassified Leptolyngbya]MBD1912008.1 polyphosphate kinase 1 [Leptolyngbya sp. FACHB-8]MBD2155378.1 polyphosphate kinase 1 [Leptolyngbya sp. FACHB-16]
MYSLSSALHTEAHPPLTDPQYFLNRELSWLEFNNRVLHEALDPRNPLLERLKFIAIFSNNLDEYFMVRVSGLKQQVEAEVTKRSPDGRTPQEQLKAIRDRLLPMVQRQHRHFQEALRPQLETHGIFFLNYEQLRADQKDYLQRYFQESIFPVLTPLAMGPGHPFPYISNLCLNLIVELRNPQTQERLLARVKVPDTLPRFIELPENLRQLARSGESLWSGVPLEQLVVQNLDELFPGMQIEGHYAFRVTRDADIEVEEDEADDLLLAIEEKLRQRRMGGCVVRVEVQASMPLPLRHRLIQEMEILPEDVYDLDGLIGLHNLMDLYTLPADHLKAASMPSVRHPRLHPLSKSYKGYGKPNEDFFSIVRQQDVLVHHPYQSFTRSVQEFITWAAHDPNVLTIKMTLYRTSGDSPIMDALVAAAENGKQVAAIVELKARFDEENNINWARILENAGVHVVYGLVGLKTHTKLVMVVRQEGDQLRRYVHIGTGNYNPKTARLYTDVGLFSCQEELGMDVTDLFNYLTGYSRQNSYRKLLVAPVNMRDRLLRMIDQEIEHRLQGKHARIVAQMNSLVDPDLIVALYRASQAGVQIDLIVRGMCALRPGVEGVSENIRVMSIVGHFLEHARILYFHNGGDEKVFIGSADWMPRNLDRRVEVMAPVESPALAKDLQAILGIMLADNRQSWELQPDGHYIQRRPRGPGGERNAQKVLMELATQAASQAS